MAKQTIGIGTVANDGTGDDLRTGGDKINDNFNEIYTAFGDGTTLGTYQVQLAEGAFANGDKTKLDGIEANADVTDAANVETAIEAITLTSVSGATGDEVLIVDATDGGLKAVLWENLPGAGGGMSSFSLAGTSGTPQTIGDGNTATIAAGTGITTTAGATDTVTVAIDSTVATLTGTQTLTNKTLTEPVINAGVTTDATTTRTLALSDASDVILMSSGSVNTVTIPTNASVAFSTGTTIVIVSTGSGTTTIEGATGVTLQGNGGSASAGSCDIQTQYGAATLIKIGTDTWIVSGDIDAVA